MSNTQILIIIGLVVAAYVYFRLRSVFKRERDVKEEVADYQRRNEIRQMQEELARLKTETTRETQAYKDAKGKYDEKYRKTPPVTGPGSSDNGGKG